MGGHASVEKGSAAVLTLERPCTLCVAAATIQPKAAVKDNPEDKEIGKFSHWR